MLLIYLSLTAKGSVSQSMGTDSRTTETLPGHLLSRTPAMTLMSQTARRSWRRCVFLTNRRIGESESRRAFIHRFTHSPILPFSFLRGGKGVGVITKPGLPVGIGEPAINPVPRKMIGEAVMEALALSPEWRKPGGSAEIIISVPEGEVLSKKTLNSRLGIAGGISILGTTGIVRPISADAWTATISASMNVAKAMGYDSIVLSARQGVREGPYAKICLSRRIVRNDGRLS